MNSDIARAFAIGARLLSGFRQSAPERQGGREVASDTIPLRAKTAFGGPSSTGVTGKRNGVREIPKAARLPGCVADRPQRFIATIAIDSACL